MSRVLVNRVEAPISIKTPQILGADGLPIPYFHVTDSGESVDKTISSGNPVPFDVKRFDTHNAWNVSTYKYTIPIAGLWLFTFGCFSAVTTFGSHRNTVQVNGSPICTTNGSGVPLAITWPCAVGDLVWVGPQSGYSMAYYASVYHNWFTGVLLR